ncbi:MAG: hypothetical protein JO354_04600, partial [Verrucomicrobia bacterium]|nr:hypothetical protein [Verrucomicrobiota bacterium]
GAAGSVDGYVGIIGPTNFGSGGVTFASSGSGDWVGVAGTAIGNFPDGIAVLHGYVSGSRLLDSAIYDNATFASLGVTPGTYEWTWGTGANQNFTLQIESARVPETGSTLAMLAMALAAVFGASRLRSAKLA